MTQSAQKGFGTAYLSIGSNIGDKRANCLMGIDALVSSNHIRLIARSRIYQTDPVDFLEQDWFINLAISIETTLEPAELMNELQQIEESAGRKRGPIRFGPRILDMDLLLFEDRVLHTPALIIPHPRMHERRFVLQPLCDIAPDVIHPVLKETVRELLLRLNDLPSGVRPVDD